MALWLPRWLCRALEQRAHTPYRAGVGIFGSKSSEELRGCADRSAIPRGRSLSKEEQSPAHETRPRIAGAAAALTGRDPQQGWQAAVAASSLLLLCLIDATVIELARRPSLGEVFGKGWASVAIPGSIVLARRRPAPSFGASAVRLSNRVVGAGSMGFVFLLRMVLIMMMSFRMATLGGLPASRSLLWNVLMAGLQRLAECVAI